MTSVEPKAHVAAQAEREGSRESQSPSFPELRELLEKATGGLPWTLGDGSYGGKLMVYRDDKTGSRVADFTNEWTAEDYDAKLADAKLLIWIRTHGPHLIEEAEDLRHAHAECHQSMLSALARALSAEQEVERLSGLLNTPQLHDFSSAVMLEAAHQRERWGSSHDAGKEPSDWFWLVGYLAGKALNANTSGNTEKALHHTISTAAALANWHAAISGAHTEMRPGIDPEARGVVTSEDRAGSLARSALKGTGEDE